MGQRAIYTFKVDCGRHGSLNGTFTAAPEDVAFAVGKTVYFQEPWGKHSGVEVTFAASMFAVKSADPAEVAMFERLGLENGDCALGLLRDCISDKLVPLTDEERAAMPDYYR